MLLFCRPSLLLLLWLLWVSMASMAVFTVARPFFPCGKPRRSDPAWLRSFVFAYFLFVFFAAASADNGLRKYYFICCLCISFVPLLRLYYCCAVRVRTVSKLHRLVGGLVGAHTYIYIYMYGHARVCIVPTIYALCCGAATQAVNSCR